MAMLCALPGCDKPRWVEPRTQIVHHYCGRQHAIAAGALDPASAPHGVCHACARPGCEFPCHFDQSTGRVHDYCSRTCAQQDRQNSRHKRSRGAPAEGERVCSLPGCTAAVFVDPDSGVARDYCGREHACRARLSGHEPVPPELAGLVDRSFKGPGGWSAMLCTNKHPKHSQVKQQFLEAWQHPPPLGKPTVHRVYQIRNPPDVFERYEQYKEQAGEHSELRRFHGTSQVCSFGSHAGHAPCMDRSCAVCNICRESFDIDRARSEESGGVPSMALRYGEGIYLAKNSSKSHSYNQGSQRDFNHGRFRVMFLCKVVIGNRPFRTQEESLPARVVRQILEQDQHTAIVGEVGPHLNYEEVVSPP